MSIHAYSRCWLHLIWGTHKRERMFSPAARVQVSKFLDTYAEKAGVYVKINFVNADHVHMLVDLPTGTIIEYLVKLFKGGSSHWINEQNIAGGRFAWGRGYGAFSVSHSDLDRVCKYIAGQEEHHRTKTFAEEYKRFVEVYGLQWPKEETVETVSPVRSSRQPLVKTRGE